MLRDVKPPVDFPPNHFLIFFLLIVVTALLAIALIYFLMRRLKAKKTETVVPPAPREIAYASLQKLKEEDLASQGRIKEYYIRLSDIVRHYIEARFDIRAREMTTEEFLLFLQKAKWLSSVQKDALGEFLSCCDMVKFAKYGSHHKEIEQSFALAGRLIDETV